MDKERLTLLFQKFLANQATPSQVEELQEYFGEDTDQTLLRELIRQEMRHEETTSRAKDSEVERIVDGLESKVLHNINKAQPTTRKMRITWLYAAAASLLIILSVGLVIYRYSEDDTPTSQLSSQSGDDILPGTNRATLTLADGSTVHLSEDKEGIITYADALTYNDGTALPETDEIVNRLPASGRTSSKIINYFTLTTPRGGQYQVTLPDGTKVWLNAASSLKYPTAFTGSERKVELTGEAYFEVTENKSQPFMVESQGHVIQVLGTAFNINAYQNESHMITTLVRGSISLTHAQTGEKAVLKPNQQALLSGQSITVHSVDAHDHIAWKEGLIVLNEADLPAIARQIERWYDVSFDTTNLPSGHSLNGEVPRNTKLSALLKIMEKNTGIKFRIEERRIIASK